MQKSKICIRCKIVKLLSEFHKATNRKDGFQAYCKTCSSEYAIQEGSFAHSKARKNYRKTPKGKKAYKNYKQNHPERIKARRAIYTEIESGRIPKANTLQCHYCGENAQQYHHYRGYEEQYKLVVVPSCTKCDRKFH